MEDTPEIALKIVKRTASFNFEQEVRNHSSIVNHEIHSKLTDVCWYNESVGKSHCINPFFPEYVCIDIIVLVMQMVL